MDLIVLKLGGSVITNKSEDKFEVNEENLTRLSKEIQEALNNSKTRLFIVHGAGPFGHMYAEAYGLTDGLKDCRQVEGFSMTHKSMEKLNSIVVESLVDVGIDAIAYQPSACAVLKDRKIVQMELKPLKKMLEMGLVPVGYGDVLIDESTGLNILSGDHLVPYIASELGAKRVIIATDYNGVFEGKPGQSKKLDGITRENIDILDGRKTSGTDVTGGIKRKVLELLDLAEAGIPSEILSGNEKDCVKRALMGEEGIGTVIKG